jgi:fatty-acyl-CoA synthase
MLPSAVQGAVEQRVLGVVQQLVTELDAGRAPRPVTLDALLDRDLGIGSLERVELLVRLEAACGARLGDETMATAATVRDLVHALGSPATARPAAADASPAISAASQGDAHPAPEHARTLLEVLRWHVDTTPDRIQVFLREDDGREHPIRYARLWQEAAAVSAALRDAGIGQGETVALLLRTEAAFFPVFFGTLLAGAVPVPLYPPVRADQIEDYARRQAAILRNAEARVLVTFAEASRLAALLKPLAPSLERVVTAGDLLARGAWAASLGAVVPAVSPDALALIQYTSGSTGTPRGVALSHANLLANMRAFGRALDVRPDDVGVSWLPLYHDMGLIGMWLGALYHGIPVVIMSPLAFLTRPSRWLHAIATHGGTLSAAPNFAYDLCARRIPDAEIAGLDLRSWRAAMNGAEPVSAETIVRFTERFARVGFRPEAMCPVYGLAETSLCLTVPDLGTRPRLDRIARDPFQQARLVRPAAPGEPAVTFVGCGRPVPTSEVRIVDAEGRVVGERVEGRIQFRGPSATRGYYRNPEATAELFQHGWLDTGDLGYWADGYLYITGRRKDIIIAGGRNIYPQEVEEAAADVPGVRRGSVAAFGSYDAGTGTERLVVVVETRERDPDARARIRSEVAGRIADLAGVTPEVVIAEPGTIPKTSSGKIRRSATRDLYQQGRLAGTRRAATWQWGRLVAANAAWRARRAAGTIAAALYTAYAWTLVALALLVLVPRLAAARDARDGSRVTRAWCRALFRLGGFTLDVRGAERLDAAGAAVFVANHASYLDAMVLRAVLPPEARFAAKDRLLRYPVLGRVLRANGVVPVERGRESSAGALAAVVARGEALAIFPEGTFVRAPGLLPFRLGAFRAAVEARCPVVPLAIRGTRRAWPDETPLIRPGRLEVVVCEPIRPEGEGWPEIVRLRDRAREAIAAAIDEPAPGAFVPASDAPAPRTA